MEQWAANTVAHREQLEVRCLAQGSHLSRGQFLPELRFEPTTSVYQVQRSNPLGHELPICMHIGVAEAEKPAERHARFSMCVVKRKPCICTIHSQQRHAEHAEQYLHFIFVDYYSQTLVHIPFLFKCIDLVLVYQSSLWQIMIHSALYSKFRFFMNEFQHSACVFRFAEIIVVGYTVILAD